MKNQFGISLIYYTICKVLEEAKDLSTNKYIEDAERSNTNFKKRSYFLLTFLPVFLDLEDVLLGSNFARELFILAALFL